MTDKEKEAAEAAAAEKKAEAEKKKAQAEAKAAKAEADKLKAELAAAKRAQAEAESEAESLRFAQEADELEAQEAEAAKREANGKYFRPVRCFVQLQSAFGVQGYEYVGIFNSLKLQRDRITYYEPGRMHVMPLAHALDMVVARRVQKDGIAMLPKGTKVPFTGIELDRSAPVPHLEREDRKTDDFVESADIDVDNLPEVSDEDWQD